MYRCVICYLSRVLINHATVLRDVVSNSSSWEEAGWAMHTSLYTCRLNAALHMHVICLKNKASSFTALHPVSLRLLQGNDFAFNVFDHHLICLYFLFISVDYSSIGKWCHHHCLVDNLCTSSFLSLHRAFCSLFNYTHQHMHIFFTCLDHVIILREHTLFLVKVII